MDYFKSKTYVDELKNVIENLHGLHKIKESSILVTGATGLIGSYIVDLFLVYNNIYGANISIYAMGRSRDKLVNRFGESTSDKLFLVEQDVTRPMKLEFKVEYIIHAASNAYPARFNNDPVGTIMGNVQGVYQLLEYGRINNIKRLLFVSTGEVYGQSDSSKDAFEEAYSGYTNPMEVRSCYPESKRMAENLCVAYKKQYNQDCIVARLCHTYGPNVSKGDNRASVQFFSDAMNGKNVVLKSKGTKFRSYCYVADAVSGLLYVLLEGKSGEAYNVANPDIQVSIAQLASAIAEQKGCKVIFDISESEMLEETPIEKQILSCDKINDLGWKAEYSLEEGIAHTYSIWEEMNWHP